MFALLFFITLFQSSVSINPKVISDVELQIDNHLQGLSINQQSDAHFWYLTKMAESSEWINQSIVNRINQLLKSRVTDVTTCYLNAFIVDPEFGRMAANRLAKASECKPDSDLLYMYIHEFPINERAEVVRRTGFEPNSNFESEALKKSLGLDYDASVLFSRREVELTDIYLLNDYDVAKNNGIHKSLIDHWRQDLNNLSNLVAPLDFVKLHVVSTSNHVLDNNFDHNFKLLQKVSGNRFHSTTIQKHVQYKRLVFAASAFGYYQNALNFYRQDLLPLSASIMPYEDYLTVRMDYSTILFRIGDIVNALGEFKELYNEIELFRDTRYLSSLLNNLAVSYLKAGFFDQYISLQLEAYDLAKELNSITYQLQILNNLFLYYRNLSDWDNALMYLDQAENLAKNSNLTIELANIRILKAIYHRDFAKEYEYAVDLLSDIASQLDSEISFRELTVTLSELSITYELMNDFSGIQLTRKRIEKLAIQRNDQIILIESLIGLGIQQYKFGKFEEAEETLSRLSSVNQEELEFRLRVQYNQLLALSKYHSGQKSDGIHILRELIPELANRIKFSGNIQTGTIFVDRSYRQVFGLLADWLLEENRFGDAIVLLDGFKNLNKTTYLNSQLLKSSVLNEDELLQDLQINNGIQRIRRELITAEESKRLDLTNQLAQLQDEQNRIFNKILQNTSDSPIDLEYVASELSKKESILSFTAIDSVLYISSITNSAVNVKREVISQSVHNLITEATEELHSGKPDLEKLFQVYKSFVSNPVLNQSEKVIVVPDAFLYSIPLEILPIKTPRSKYAYGSTEYLIESLAISYSNSIDDFIKRKRGDDNEVYGTDFLGFGVSEFNFEIKNPRNERLSPLPFAVNEIYSSAEVLRDFGSVDVLVNSSATKSQLFSKAGDSRIVHLASHSQVNNIDPLFSQIYFQDAESGFVDPIYAYELFNLSLKTELMVLSSCDSGSGSYSEGSGIIGLGRALNFAGAESLILNTWSIRDKTASDIMVSFYESIRVGKGKDESLRSAKIAYMNGSNSNPAVWGSLILFGNPDAINNKSDYQYYWIVGFIMAITVFFIYRRRINP